MNIAIVGAGIGGLYCVLRLLQINSKFNITIFETRPFAGGRIQKFDFCKKKVDFGAWRVSNSHQRMMTLAKRLNIKLIKMLPQISQSDIKCKTLQKQKEKDNNNLSIFENYLKNQSIRDAICHEMHTGYDDILSGINTTYLVTQKHRCYYVPKSGMYEFIERLIKLLNNKVKIHYNARVTHIQKQKNKYTLVISQRNNHNTFKNFKKEYNCIFMNTPPSVFDNIQTNFNLELKPIQAAIKSIPFFRIYVSLKKEYKNPIYFKNKSIFRQIILLNKNTLMLCYCSGRIANFHNNFAINNKEKYKKFLKIKYKELVKTYSFLIKYKDINWNTIKFKFFEHGVHYFDNIAINSNFSKKDLIKCIKPHINLPKLFLINEAYSNIQGWSEGALQSVDIALDLFKKKIEYKHLGITKDHIIFNQRRLNVKKWMHVHPGSKQAILNHLQEDCTKLILHQHNHTTNIYKYIFALSDGFI